MTVKRRTRVKRRGRRRRRIKMGPWARYFHGGYMGNDAGFVSPMDKSHLINDKKEFLEELEKKKPSKFWLPSYLNHKINKNVIDDVTMNQIAIGLQSDDTNKRNLAREQLHDLLIMRDIDKNPDDYMREWLQGKHKKNTWVKTAARVGLGTAAALGTGYLLYNWGTPMLGLTINGLSSLKNWLGSSGAAAANPADNLQSLSGMSLGNQVIPSTGNSTEESIFKVISDGFTANTGKFKLSSEGNTGLLGYNPDIKQFLVEGADGVKQWIEKDGILSFALQNPSKFGAVIGDLTKEYGNNKGIMDIINRAAISSGSGFRVTKRGRRLLRRYRHHLRRRRRH